LPFAWPAIIHGCYRESHLGSAAVAASFSLSRLRHVWQTKVSQFIALTEFSKRKFVEGGIPEAKIEVKPNSTMDLGVGPHDRSYALYVGRLTEEKGIRVLLQAVEAGLVCPLKVVGDGPLSADVAKFHNAGKLEWVRQCPREQVTGFMKAATCLLFPSLWFEGMPMVIAEALATGLPIVASRLGSMTSLIADDVNGYLVQPGSVTELGSAITTIISDQVLQKRMQVAARQIYLQRFEPDANCQALIGIYERAIAEMPPQKTASSRVPNS
jgi:glycosyltransferase involved in cell wall biosynthesis